MSGEVERIADLQRERDEAREALAAAEQALAEADRELAEARKQVSALTVDLERSANLAKNYRADLGDARKSVAALNAHIAADHESMDKLIDRLRVRGLLGIVEGLV